MKKIAIAFATVLTAVSGLAADTQKECTLCVGIVSPSPAPSQTVPLLVRADASALSTASAVDGLSPEQRRNTTVVLPFLIAQGDTVAEIEQRSKSVVDWARAHGPFDTLALTIEGDDPVLAAYAVKRVAVTAQGLDVASRIGVGPSPLTTFQALVAQEAQSYFDVALVGSNETAAAAGFFAANDPSKKIFALVDPQAPNPAYDLARALADGATRAFATTGVSAEAAANMNRALAGDFAFDSTARTTVLDAKGNPTDVPVVTFVRGEDLRSVIVPRGESAAATIVALPSDRFERPRRVDASGERAITDTGKKGGRLLVGIQPVKDPFVLLADYAEKPQKGVKEAIEVATQRGITVEEIIRNHQAYDSYQESIRPRYIARDATTLRFDIGGGGDSLEATIAGDYFSDPNGRSDWVWQDFLINGVKWKYGRIPELPLIQPEKVTQLPLQLHLTNEYRYRYVRETDLLGYHAYEVRFEPPPNAPESLPLYRGTVWIDSKSWARIRISMIQLNLTGEVLSNEERVDFQPFDRATKQPIASEQVAKSDPRSVLWLTREVAAQQVISAAGRASVVLRTTEFTEYRIDPQDFDARLQQASASDARMVRETPAAGLRYLEKRGDGDRVVKEGFDTARTFMLGGIHHDAGLQYPVVPLGGIDYFNFDLGHRGIQTNVFFAGVVLAANATHPNIANTRTNAGADFFGIAIPTENTVYRDGAQLKGDTVKSLPLNLTLRAGHPFLQFAKADLSFGISHTTYQRAEDTAADFVVPSDTFELGPSIELRYARWGWGLSAFYDYRTRTSWKPWGDLTEYDPKQKTHTTFGASFGKSFYLPKFQRISIDVNYLDGQRLDRFSKYGLGFFGAQRIHGIKSGSVQAERALLSHLSYGFVFSDQFRMEAFYDQGLLDDTVSGYDRALFQGVGIAGQTIGPYGTLLRLDIGKTIGKNRQDGFVANVVFLKLF